MMIKMLKTSKERKIKYKNKSEGQGKENTRNEKNEKDEKGR